MTSVLLDGESLASGLRRVARADVDAARAGLAASDPAEPPLEGIHEARRRLKRVRALLRLVRPDLDEAVYGEQNRSYRDVGRALAPARDAQVLVETATRLVENVARDAAALLESLRTRRDDVVARTLPPGTTKTLDGRLGTARRAVSAWTPPTLDWRSVEGGLRRSYDAGRRALRTIRRAGADASATARAYHDWRKRAKDLRHQLEFLSGVWPPMIEALETELHRLTDLLGEGNDQVVFLRVLEEEVPPEIAAGLPPVADMAREARDRAWREAELLGGRIWAEAPAVFSRRIGSYWAAWRG